MVQKYGRSHLFSIPCEEPKEWHQCVQSSGKNVTSSLYNSKWQSVSQQLNLGSSDTFFKDTFLFDHAKTAPIIAARN